MPIIQVGIIVPIYNAGKFKLVQCIKSILRQTYRDFVLILVDDGSTDNSGSVCDSFAVQDTRIKVIHQKNKGSLEARKAGVFSQEAQAAKYICFCDSDDTMPKHAIEKLISIAEQYHADCVCGTMRRTWNGIPLPSFKPPCFDISEEAIYDHDDIINKLYVSCFGISNFPVNLSGKIYTTDCIASASNFESIVKFMGEDLSVTVRLLPVLRRLVIIPDNVYSYRLGGGTSKFMPFMLDDFLSLYNFKKQMAVKCPMPQNIAYLLGVEMKNIVLSWLEMCITKGNYSFDALRVEIARVCNLPEVQDAVTQEDFAQHEPFGIRKALQDCDVEKVASFVTKKVAAGWFKRAIKDLLK